MLSGRGYGPAGKEVETWHGRLAHEYYLAKESMTWKRSQCKKKGASGSCVFRSGFSIAISDDGSRADAAAVVVRIVRIPRGDENSDRRGIVICRCSDIRGGSNISRSMARTRWCRGIVGTGVITICAVGAHRGSRVITIIRRAKDAAETQRETEIVVIVVMTMVIIMATMPAAPTAAAMSTTTPSTAAVRAARHCHGRHQAKDQRHNK